MGIFSARRLRGLCLGLAVVVPCVLSAHVVYDRRTLSEWTSQARVIAIAEVRAPLKVWSAPDGSDHQEYWPLEVVRSLRGTLPVGPIDVFVHAEGQPRWSVGDRVVVFLDRTAERAEFRGLAERFPRFSTQGAGQEWITDDAGKVEAAVVSWRRWWQGDAGYAGRRDLVLAQLSSGQRGLEADALVELIRLKSSEEFAGDAIAHERLRELIRSPKLSVPRRVGLIKLLDGGAGVDAGLELARLTEGHLNERERVALIRACHGVAQPQVVEWLEAQLSDPSASVRAAARHALGQTAGR